MAMIADPTVDRAPRKVRRRLAALALAIFAAAGVIAIFAGAPDVGGRGGFSGPALLAAAISEKVHQGVNKVKSVADLLAGRSPGQRARGTLANLKHKRHARVLHARVLPKKRKELPAATPLASIVAPPGEAVPPAPAVIPPTTPIFNAVTSAAPEVQTAETKPPIVFPGIPPFPGSGYVVPPGGVPQVPLGGPGSPVPEPESWLLMLVGFGLVGGFVRQNRKYARS